MVARAAQGAEAPLASPHASSDKVRDQAQQAERSQSAMTVTMEKPHRLPVNRMARAELAVATEGPGFVEITGEIERFLSAAEARDGMLCLFIRHTSASLTIQENIDPDVLSDLRDSLERLAPHDADYRHRAEGADDMPSHVRTMLTDVSLAIPVSAGRLALGTYQGVFLVEHRARGRRRAVTLTYLGA
jgi:secondary thiamine-phosphate synthase enzyme